MVRTKGKHGKRKLEFQGKRYYWGVVGDFPCCLHKLCIVSEDKKIRIAYELDYSIHPYPITPSYIKSVLEKMVWC